MDNSKKLSMSIIVGIFLVLYSFVSFAVNISPVGKWTTMSDNTHKPRSSIINIWKTKGVLYGKNIESL